MKKNTISQIISCALAVGMSGAAMAGPQFYGAITYGAATTSGDDTINYALFDSSNTESFSPIGTRYGNSELAGIKLGLRFDSKLFLELSRSQKNFDGAGFGGNGGTEDCTITPSADLTSLSKAMAASSKQSSIRPALGVIVQSSVPPFPPKPAPSKFF